MNGGMDTSSKLDEIMEDLRGDGPKTGLDSEYNFKMDLKGNILSATPEAVEISGYTDIDITSMSVWDVVSEEDHDIMLENFAARRQGGPLSPYEVTLVTKEGKRIRIKVDTTPIKEKGKVVAIKGTFIPIED